MLKIPGYLRLELITNLPNLRVYRAFSEKREGPVLLKVLRAEFPIAEDLANFENEFNLLKMDLGPGVPRAFELLLVERARVMVTEDIGGASLAQLLTAGDLSLGDRLEVSKLMTQALSAIQAHGIIHRDLKPDNIVYNAESKRLQIINFGLAVKASEVPLTELKSLTGSVQYMAPEQTGRTQRGLDYRADYYALGVTLYQMFSGKLPFAASDQLQWVHCQIAQTQTPLVELDKEIPLAVSKIVQKLMRKSPDERYQSCLGLLHDLSHGLNTESFVLGERDAPAEFRLSTKLYGRQQEVHRVEESLAKTIGGEKRLILVDGDPGIGKSSLVGVVKAKVAEVGGYFISGKYDQFNENVPFSALIQAFNLLVGRVLSEEEGKIFLWRDCILKALGENAAVVTQILPSLELVIGKQPQVVALQGNELKQRFHMTFHAFLRACSAMGHPLVIFLDDLQWADSASRSLLLTFLTEKDSESLLFIGCYRSDEVPPTHPLRQLFTDLSEKGIEAVTIHLKGLGPDDIAAMVRDSFGVPFARAVQLASLVIEKTAGNPFFVTQFLSRLHEMSLIQFSPTEGWNWELDQIREQAVTGNVLALLGDKIKSLPIEVQKLLQIAAVMGNQFQIDDLGAHNDRSPAENQASAESAQRSGLLSPVGNGNYRFVHDRVQEAAYQMLSAAERQAVHWRIANQLAKKWTSDEAHGDIFQLVNHWNAGASFVASEADQKRGAEFNLIAARRAKEASVYDLAVKYAQQGQAMLASDDWLQHGSILGPLLSICAEAQYALSQFESAEKSFHLLLKRVTDTYEKARIYRTMVDLAHMKDRNRESIRWGALGLALLGVKLPDNPSKVTLLSLMLSARWQLRRLIKSGRIETALPSSVKSQEIMSLFSSISAPTYQVNKNQLAFAALSAMLISIKEGFLDLNGRAFFTALLWEKFKSFYEAAASADYLLKAVEIAEPTPNTSRSLFVLGGFSLHVVRSRREALRILDRAIHIQHQNGDLLFAATSALYAGSLHALSETKLETSEANVLKYSEVIRKINYPLMQDCLSSIELFVKCMIGKTVGPRSFSTSELSEEQFVAKLRKHESPNPVAWYETQKLLALYIMGDYAAAFDHVDGAQVALSALPFAPVTLMNRTFSALTIFKNLQKFKGVKRWRLLRQARSQHKFIRKLSEQNPAQYLAAYLLLEAELHRVSGRFEESLGCLTKASAASKTGELALYEAVANELASDLLHERGFAMAASLYRREAHFVYNTWGASAKCAVMTEKYPELAISKSAANTNSTLDIDSVLKATNTLISEVEMSELVQKLLNVLIENAGAEKAVLVLIEDEVTHVVGEVQITKDAAFVLQSLPLIEYTELPHAMTSYVSRTRQSLVLENAMQDERVNRDEYIQRTQVLSAMCIPILSQGEVKGIIYLENGAAAGTFSVDRVELIQILAGQAAISIENARLYKQQGEKIRMQNELATAQAVQETLFPAAVADFSGANISGYYTPATECGGDWWYYSKIGQKVFIWIGDATGHGAPAALVTAAACSAVSVLETLPDLNVSYATGVLNQAIYRTTKGRINMTFFAGALNLDTGEFNFVRASHELPFILRADRTGPETSFSALREGIEYLRGEEGLPLGELNDFEYKSTSVQLNPGDQIVFHTDGLTELRAKDGQAWGERRFLKAIHGSYLRNESTESMVESIIGSATDFGGHAALADDITLCVLKYTGREGAKLKNAS